MTNSLEVNSPNDVYKSIYGKSTSSTNTSSEYPITQKSFARDKPIGTLYPLGWLLSTKMKKDFQP